MLLVSGIAGYSWQRDVEAAHKVIEDEFYDIEGYRDVDEFMKKSYADELYFDFKKEQT